MSLISLSPHRLSSHGHRLPGSPHRGSAWRHARRNLHTAVQNAMHHANWRSQVTADGVGTELIDLVGEMNKPALEVLRTVAGDLVRESRKGN